MKLITQLSDTGILIAPIGPGEGPQRLTLFQRIGQSVDTRDLGCRAISCRLFRARRAPFNALSTLFLF